jgi:hypothetical protein
MDSWYDSSVHALITFVFVNSPFALHKRLGGNVDSRIGFW